jgi:hypothetical protein
VVRRRLHTDPDMRFGPSSGSNGHRPDSKDVHDHLEVPANQPIDRVDSQRHHAGLLVMGGTSARTRRERLRSERGQTLVEFALGLVVLVITLIGTAEFGVAIFRYNMVSDLAQEGARWAMVRGSGSGSMKASIADVQNFVRSRALGINVTVITSVDPMSLVSGQTIQVEVQHVFPMFTRIVPLGTITLRSTAQMIMAR